MPPKRGSGKRGKGRKKERRVHPRASFNNFLAVVDFIGQRAGMVKPTLQVMNAYIRASKRGAVPFKPPARHPQAKRFAEILESSREKKMADVSYLVRLGQAEIQKLERMQSKCGLLRQRMGEEVGGGLTAEQRESLGSLIGEREKRVEEMRKGFEKNLGKLRKMLPKKS